MTRYLLDTNIISDLVTNAQGNAAKRIAKAGEANVSSASLLPPN